MQEIKDQAKKDAEDIWENGLKNEFSSKINEYFNNLFKNIDTGLENCQNSVNNQIRELEKKYEEKIELLSTNPLINIILRCISNLYYIVNYYRDPLKLDIILKKSKENPGGVYLNPSFINFLDYIWENKKEKYPKNIHNILKKIMDNDYYSNNPGIIINYILNELNEELISDPIINNNENYNPFEYFDKQKTFERFKKNFKKTIISQLFFSSIKIKKKCTYCQSKYEYFFKASPIINIYLENKNNNIVNKFNLKDDLKDLIMSKEENNIREECLLCKSEQNKFVQKEIVTTSLILIINIIRKNNKIFFKYPEQFNGKEIINNEIGIPNYELSVVIKRVKNNELNNCKYIAYYKDCNNKNWLSYNNKKIESIQNNYNNIIFDDENACMLIYTSKN